MKLGVTPWVWFLRLWSELEGRSLGRAAARRRTRVAEVPREAGHDWLQLPPLQTEPARLESQSQEEMVTPAAE